MPRERCVDYSHGHFEFLIRNFDQWLWTPRPKAFATALDENPISTFYLPLMCGPL